jgi:glutamine synthetase
VINTAVAEVLRQFADFLESAKPHNFKADLAALIRRTYSKHKRVIYSGDNYSPDWVKEAAKRGLSNFASTVDALEKLVSPENVALYEQHGVLTETEVRSRFEIRMESYAKTINIEALTMLNIAKTGILPACVDYQNDLAKLLERKRSLGSFDCSAEERLLKRIARLSGELISRIDALELALADAVELAKAGDSHMSAVFYHDNVFAFMTALRKTADELETLVAKKYWCLPDYGDLLYSVV